MRLLILSILFISLVGAQKFVPGTVPECLPGDTKACNGHGLCRVDASCACYAGFYGMNCTLVINRQSGALTDGGLGGVIIGWLIGLGLFTAGAFWLYNQLDSGKLDWEDVFCCCCRSCARSRSPNAGHGHDSDAAAMFETSTTPEPLQMSVMTINKEPEVGDEKAVAHAAAAAGASGVDAPHSGHSPHSVILAHSGHSGGDPPQAEALIGQVLDIMGQGTTRDQARKALAQNNWNMERALATLLQGV